MILPQFSAKLTRDCVIVFGGAGLSISLAQAAAVVSIAAGVISATYGLFQLYYLLRDRGWFKRK